MTAGAVGEAVADPIADEADDLLVATEPVLTRLVDVRHISVWTIGDGDFVGPEVRPLVRDETLFGKDPHAVEEWKQTRRFVEEDGGVLVLFRPAILWGREELVDEADDARPAEVFDGVRNEFER